jgi:hypothetical protein
MRFSNQVKKTVAVLAVIAASVPAIAGVTVTCNGVTVSDPTSASCSCVNGNCTTTTGQPVAPRPPVCFTIFGTKYCF